MQRNIKTYYHIDDLPLNAVIHGSVAIDSEFMGLNPRRDALCTIQLIDELAREAHIVHFKNRDYRAPVLKALLRDSRKKIFHFARSDLAFIQSSLQIEPEEIENVFCTKIASRIARTYTRNHGLKDLCRDLLGVKISKEQQTSDWGAHTIAPEQIEYAISDVIYLHDLMKKLTEMLNRENRYHVAERCFKFVSLRAWLDYCEWPSSLFDYEYKD